LLFLQLIPLSQELQIAKRSINALICPARDIFDQIVDACPRRTPKVKNLFRSSIKYVVVGLLVAIGEMHFKDRAQAL